MRVLTVNAGSTSWKVVEVEDGRARPVAGGLAGALEGDAPDAVAHRVVHGGDRTEAVAVDDVVVGELDRLTSLAPLHQPAALDGIERCRRRWPDIPNVAVFDTAFHATIPRHARTYALPAHLRDLVPASGFHGISYAWSSGVVARHAPAARRVLLAHLGGGQSLCAVHEGRSVWTTMGFSTIGGLVMSTRCGDVDPGALLWLQARAAEPLLPVLEHESGLLGLCGSSDLREVEARASDGDDAAELAYAVWRHRLVTLAGSGIAVLGGIDALVLTGGIGEHDAAARATLGEALGWVGVGIGPPTPLEEGVTDVTAPGAPVRTFVVAAREDLQLATEAERLLRR